MGTCFKTKNLNVWASGDLDYVKQALEALDVFFSIFKQVPIYFSCLDER